MRCGVQSRCLWMALLFFRGAVTKPLCSPQECHRNWGKDRDFLEGRVGKAGQNRRASGSMLLSCPTVSSQQSRSTESHRGEMKDIPGGLRTPEMTPLSSFGGQLFEGVISHLQMEPLICPVESTLFTDPSVIRAIKKRALLTQDLLRKLSSATHLSPGVSARGYLPSSGAAINGGGGPCQP